MYFGSLPTLIYNEHDGVTSGIRSATDILTRIAFTSDGITGSEFFINYFVRDQDTPESIAYNLYGSAEYHWIVLLFNNILNPLFDWPKNVSKFEKHLATKYNGVSVFVDTGISGTFKVDDTIVGTKNGGSTFLARVTDYNPTLHKIVVTNITPNGSVIAPDDVLKAYNTTGGALLENDVGYAVARRIVIDSTAALHHFGVSGSITAGYNDVGGGAGTSILVLDPLSKYDGITQVGLHQGITYGNTLVYGYINGGSESYVITNRDFETELNESNRVIRMASPTVVPSIVQNFKTLMK